MVELKEQKKESYELIKKLIESKGYKMTTQRERILMEFIENKDEHLNAEKVYNILKTEGIGISTVYRNINLFVDLNILKEFKVDETSYYELKMYAKKPLHIHFICEECETLVDIKDRDIILQYLNINNSIENNYKIQINDVDIMFHGLCNKCAEKKQNHLNSLSLQFKQRN